MIFKDGQKILDDFDASEDMWVGRDGHRCYFFHGEEVLGDLVFDGLEVNDLDGDLGLIGYIFGWIRKEVPE